MILWNDTVSVGDGVTSFPGTLMHCRRNPRFDRIYWTNSAVGDLFPHAKYDIIRVPFIPHGAEYEKISVNEMVHHGLHGHSHVPHPANVFAGHLGYTEDTHQYLVPEICYPDIDVPVYDWIIAPFVMHDARRIWPMQRWTELIALLSPIWPHWTFGIIGSTQLPPKEDLTKVDPYNVPGFEAVMRYQMAEKISGANVSYELDRPLYESINLMARARCGVLTVDSGPARLMQAIARPQLTHMILADNSVGKEWASYPGAHVIYGNLRALTAQQVYHELSLIIKERFGMP